jgi:hypothetical protein
MAEGQVIIDDNGGNRQGNRNAANFPIEIFRKENNVEIAMDELTRGMAHHIPGVQIDQVVVTTGGNTSTIDSPSHVIVTSMDGVRFHVRNRSGYVQVRAGEDLKEPNPDVYNTANKVQIAAVQVDQQSIAIHGNTTVKIGYDGM